MSIEVTPAVVLNGSGLLKYDAACRAIAEAKAVDELKDIRDTARAMIEAARVAKNKQAEADLAAIRFRAERRLGEMLAAQREAGMLSNGAANAGWKETRVDAPVTLAEVGIDKNLADRARKYAAVPSEDFEKKIEEYRETVVSEGIRASSDLLAYRSHRTIGTGENEWYTPALYIEAVRLVLGGIDLDPASCRTANDQVMAARYFDKETDGIKQDWHGRVFLNPPYSQPEISHFIDKIITEYESKRVTSAIVVTHNFTDTRWHHRLFEKASALCFTSGRVKFISPTGEFAAPTNGQTFSYFGTDVDKFYDVFGKHGAVVRTVQPKPTPATNAYAAAKSGESRIITPEALTAHDAAATELDPDKDIPAFLKAGKAA